jgi:hypothetical protein
MPRRNRVRPDGEIVAEAARGRLLGNRGVLHDEQGRIVRPFKLQRWLYCRLEFRGRRRQLMAPGRYTELFFRDEPTALAAGHRPCGECLPARLKRFRRLWPHDEPLTEIDRRLHDERLHRTLTTSHPAGLPTGAMVQHADSGTIAVVLPGQLLRWSFADCTPWEAPPGVWTVLTPPATLAVLAAGFLDEFDLVAAGLSAKQPGANPA